MDAKYIRPADVVRQTGLSKTTVMEAVWKGQLEAYRVGRSWLIPAGAMERWIGHIPDSDAAVYFGVAVSHVEDRVIRAMQRIDTSADGWIRRGVILRALGNVKRLELSKALHSLNAKGLLEERTSRTRTKPAEEWRIIDWSAVA